MGKAAEGDEFADSESIGCFGTLREDRQLFGDLFGGEPMDSLAIEVYGAALGLHQPREAAEESGFPRAVRADQRGDLLARDFEAQVANDFVLVVGEGQMFGGELNHGRCE